MHGHTILQEKRAAEIFDEIGQRSFERVFPGFTEDSLEQATLSAGQSGVGNKRARDVVGPAHLGALIAAKPGILSMIQDAATAGFLPKQPFVALLDAVIEAATVACVEALDGSEKATASLHLQKAAQAASESWQQTVRGHTGPTVSNPTVLEVEQSGASQDDEDDSELTFAPHRKSRLSAPQLQAQLSRLSDRTQLRRPKDTHSNGAWQHVIRIEDLRQTHVSHKWLHHSDACAGIVHSPHDNNNVEDVVCVEHSWTHSLSTEDSAAPPKPLGDIMHTFTPS